MRRVRARRSASSFGAQRGANAERARSRRIVSPFQHRFSTM